MQNLKKDPLGTVTSTIFVISSIGFVGTVAQSSAQHDTVRSVEFPVARGSQHLAKAPRAANTGSIKPNGAEVEPPVRHPDGPPFGPPPGGPPHSEDGKAVGRELGAMLQGLNLNSQQQSSLNTLMESERRQMQALHEQMHQLHTKTRSGVDALLSSEQRQKLNALEKEACANRPDGPPHGDGPPQGPPKGNPGGYER